MQLFFWLFARNLLSAITDAGSDSVSLHTQKDCEYISQIKDSE